MNVPVIETQRLILRAHRLADVDACAAMWADPLVTRYISGKPSSPQESWFRVLRYAGLWELLGFGYWAVEERATGHFLGDVGFADYRRGIEPLEGAPELGWVFSSSAHGKGYATEAAGAAVAWGDANLESTRTVCIIDPENAASVRVAQKLGFHEFERVTFSGQPAMLFERRA